MKIAFLASRKGYLKVMGSLIQAALDRGHEAILLCDPGERKPGEAVTPADLGHWPAARVLTHRRGEPLLPVLRAAGATALVGPSLHLVLTSMGRAAEMAAARDASVRLYSVDYVLETLTSDPEAYRVIDVTFYATEFERRLHWDLLRERFAAVARAVSLEARSAVSGSTMLDQLALVDRDAVRRRLGLAAGRPVVLLMSLKMAVPEPYRRYVWRDGSVLTRAAVATASGHVGLVPEIWKGNGYRDLVAAVRDFCRRSGAALVVKSREKNRDPRFLRRSADVFVESDEAVYPYTSIELMAIADLCVHFQSGAVLEAAAAVGALAQREGAPDAPARLSRTRGGVRRPRRHAPALHRDRVGRRARGGAGPVAGPHPRRLQDRSRGPAPLPRALRGRRRRPQQSAGARRHRTAALTQPRRRASSSSAIWKSSSESMFTDASRGITYGAVTRG